MQVVETTREGLKRELKITVPKEDLSSRLEKKLLDLKSRVRLNGFRQGKVPVAHLRKVYGKQAMAEVVNEVISSQSGKILAERAERAAQQPEIVMTEDETEAEAILAGKADFEFTMAYEVLPEITAPDIETLEIVRPVLELTDDEIREQAEKVAESTRDYEEKDGAAETGDRVTIDYAGTIGGEAFEGGADQDAVIVLGSNRFLPGFEDQLVGKKAGDEVIVKLTFPADYRAEHLAGSEAEFAVTVKKVEKPAPLELNDETARKLGLESVEKMFEGVRRQVESYYGSFTQAKVKRQVLDQLDAMTKMDLPQKMVEQEFQNIWGQVTEELERTGRTFADEDTTEEKAREEYRSLAERRVRLGLVLAHIGEKAGIGVSEEEMQRAIYDQVRMYPGQEKQVLDYFREHPDAVAGLRAPLYENKVVEYIVSKAKVTDKSVSREELTREED